MAKKPGKRIPRLALLVVPILAIGVILVLLGLAWRSSREIRSTSGTAVDTTTQAATGGSFLGCTECHGDLDKVFKEGGAPTLLYTHEEHFAQGVSDCSVCHPPNTHEADTINKPTMSRCFTCHGVTKMAIASGTCNSCHPPGLREKPPTHLAAGWLRERHGEEAKVDQFQCLTCHKQSFCSSCHGVDMPHAEGWGEAPHTQAFFDDPKACQLCHPRAPQTADSCDTCHHPQVPKDTAWRTYHPNVVKDEGAYTCFQCHDPATCATCHVEGKENFEADMHRPPTPVPTPSGG